MIPYVILVLLLLFYSNRKNYIAIMVILTVFAVVRYDVGWDYMTYYNIAKDPEATIDYQRFSFVWKALFMFAHITGLLTLPMVVTSFLTCTIGFYGIYLLLDGQREKICDALLIYAFWPFFYLGELTIIRQGLAVSIALLMYGYIRRKQYKVSCFLFLFNLLIHPSSVVTLIMFPILINNYQFKFKSILVSVVLGVASISLIKIAISYVGIYAHYLEMEADFGGMLSFLLLGMGLWMFLSMYIGKTKGLSVDGLGLVIIALILESVIYLLGLPSVFSRPLMYFSILLIVVYTDMVEMISPLYRRLSIMMLVLLVLWYLNHSQISSQELSVNGYVPYKTLFELLF